MTTFDSANTLHRIIEMNRIARTFCLSRFYRYSYDSPEEQEAVNIELRLVSDSGDKLEINVHGELTEAADEAWLRMQRFLGRNPEFDPNKTLEHIPAAPVDDEVPF